MAGKKLKISFGGCGFLGVYHAGVGKCVKDHAPHLFDRFDTFYGASVGAITAVCAACKSDPMVPYKWAKKTFEASRKYHFGTLHPSFDLYTRLRDFLEGFLPKNAHRLVRGKVKISLTTFPERKNWLVTDFNTRKELINVSTALCSLVPRPPPPQLLSLSSWGVVHAYMCRRAPAVIHSFEIYKGKLVTITCSLSLYRLSLQAVLFQCMPDSKICQNFVARYIDVTGILFYPPNQYSWLIKFYSS